MSNDDNSTYEIGFGKAGPLRSYRNLANSGQNTVLSQMANRNGLRLAETFLARHGGRLESVNPGIGS